MDPFHSFNGLQQGYLWQVTGLDPLPEEEWQRILNFLQLTQSERSAMLATVEALFRRGHELVVGTYDLLLQNPDTAAILGWEQGADLAHLSERRRFFTIWLARLLGLDMSNELAHYLFRAGKLHAGHGPRRTHVPPLYVTGSVSLVNATFARFLHEEMSGDAIVPVALAGWNKLLTAHLHLMQLGYQAAITLDSGDFQTQVELFGKMRTLLGTQSILLHLSKGAQMHHTLRKLFNYFPAARAEVFDLEWEGGEQVDHRGTPWFTPEKVYRIKPMWRVLVNGRDISYLDGAETPVHEQDTIEIFPPGR
ncbi:MAG: protoglobin domain-containing protein [Caldilineaceae bacterium]